MKVLVKPLTGLALTASLVATAALAQVPLNQEKHINDSLVAARVADVIRNECSSISARLIVFYQKTKALEQYARDQGYTEPEVKAFLKNKTEKARIKGLAADYLARIGAKEGDEESYCAAGRSEIAKGTLAGELLSSWK